jgi:REP element-mobilizing transposase RayT
VGFFVDFHRSLRHTSAIMSAPWNNWYHVTVHTYGSWLRGDPRGWRARHHREHVDGDYKHPPPKGMYDRLLARSQALMTRDPVRISTDLRQFVVDAVVEKLQSDQIEIIVAALDGNHLHLLARFPDHDPRHWTGRAKKHASHLLRQSELRDETGGIWAKRSKIHPIRDRQHQLNTFQYILAHQDRGAAIWRVARPQSHG